MILVSLFIFSFLCYILLNESLAQKLECCSNDRAKPSIGKIRRQVIHWDKTEKSGTELIHSPSINVPACSSLLI